MSTPRQTLWTANLGSALLVAALITFPAHARDRDRDKNRKKEEAPAQQSQAASVSGPSASELMGVHRRATEKLEALEKLMASKDYGSVRAQARDMVLELASQAGIELKTPGIIQVGELLDRADLYSRFDRLTSAKRFAIARIVKEHKAAYFPDLLNLAKRAQVYYLRAQYEQMQSLGQYRARDEEYIKQQLRELHAIPLFFGSEKLGKDVYVAFDSELIDVTVQFEFNRELLEFALSIQSASGGKATYSESEFEQDLESFRNDFLSKHWDGIVPPAPPVKIRPNHFSAKVIDNGDGTKSLMQLKVNFRGEQYAVRGSGFVSIADYVCKSFGLGKFVEVSYVVDTKSPSPVYLRLEGDQLRIGNPEGYILVVVQEARCYAK